MKRPPLIQHHHRLPHAPSCASLRWHSFRTSKYRLRAASRLAVAASSSQVTLFPAGNKQAKVSLPAFIIIVSATEVVQRRDSIAEEIGTAISAGANGVLPWGC